MKKLLKIEECEDINSMLKYDDKIVGRLNSVLFKNSLLVKLKK